MTTLKQSLKNLQLLKLKERKKSFPYSLKVFSSQLLIVCAIHVPYVFIFLRDQIENKPAVGLFLRYIWHLIL